MNTKKTNFFSENLLLSIGGHLIVIALMVTSLYIVFEKSKLIAPDRVQIMEIDLSQVQITQDESQLYNTEFPEQKPEPEENKAVKEQEAKPKEIDAPTLVETKKSVDKDKTKPKPVVKKKMIVRVNRETTNLNRSMTISVIDALRVALTRCWTIDRTRPDIADIRAVVHIIMYSNGRVADLWFEGATRAETDPAFAYVIETIKTAITVCQPFSMLPQNEYENWKNIQLTFYPSNKEIQ